MFRAPGPAERRPPARAPRSRGPPAGAACGCYTRRRTARAMKTQAAFCWILSFSAFAWTALLPRQAGARACTVASDCPKGFDCGPGGVAPDGGPAQMCVSLSCQTNSDCGPGLSCYLDMGTVCQTAPDGGTTCGAGSACVPQWDAPCLTAADCGPGFTCSPGLMGYDCGKDQDASRPVYENAMTVPCSAVPMFPLPFPDSGPPPGFPAIPPLCDAGSTCTAVSVNQCVAQQSVPCSGDSDCPSTWTCGCETNCDGPVLASDGGCMMVCVAPNSDLVLEVCAGGAQATPSGGGGSAPAPSSPGASDSGAGAAGSGASPGAAGSSGGHGGCQIGSDSTSASWVLVGAGVLAWARWRPRRPRRVTR
jgi:hypothetical protein